MCASSPRKLGAHPRSSAGKFNPVLGVAVATDPTFISVCRETFAGLALVFDQRRTPDKLVSYSYASNDRRDVRFIHLNSLRRCTSWSYTRYGARVSFYTHTHTHTHAGTHARTYTCALSLYQESSPVREEQKRRQGPSN